MKHSILPVLSLVLLSSCTMSKRVSVFVVPPLTAQAQDTVDVAAYEVKYQGYEGVYLDVERTFEHYGAKEEYARSWNFAVIDRRKYMVLDPEASWLTSFRLTFKPDTMYIRIVSPDGRIRTYGKKDLKEEKVASGYTYYTMVYPEIVKGTISRRVGATPPAPAITHRSIMTLPFSTPFHASTSASPTPAPIGGT
jgi:hypothetical protein